MPELIGKTIHLPVTPEDKKYASVRTISISKDQGISALYGQPDGAEAWEIKTYLFDTDMGWDTEKAHSWIKEQSASATQTALSDDAMDAPPVHQAAEMSQDEMPIPNGMFEEVPEPSQYITIRQHDKAKFNGYRNIPFHRTYAGKQIGATAENSAGIIAALGTWKKTGAQVVQKLHFGRDQGWTDDKVKTWFNDHPQFTYPETSGLFVALSESVLNMPDVNELTVSQDMQTLDATQEFSIFDVVVIQGGWGKNRRRGHDGGVYQDYFTREFLQSLLPSLEGSAVQAVKLVPKNEAAASQYPPLIRAIVAELQQHGHPPDVINLILNQGLVGNAIGFLKNVRLEDGLMTDALGITQSVPQIRASFVLADSEAANDARALLKSAWQAGLKKALGLSINYRATVAFGDIAGRPACIFQQATHHVSTEFVPNPAAGGLIVGVVQQEEQNMPEDIKKEDVVETPEDEEQEKQDVPAAAPKKDETAAVQAQKPTAQPQPMHDSRIDELKDLIAAVGGSVQSVVSELGAMKDQQRRGDLTVMVTQSDNLTDAAKTQILTAIADGSLKSPDQVKAMIAVAQSNIPEPSAPVFPGLAGHVPRAELLRDRKDVMKVRSYLMWGLPLTQSEQDLATKYRIEPFYGIKDEYVTYTGDSTCQFHGLGSKAVMTFAQNVHPDTVLHSARYRGLEDDLMGGNFAQTIATTTYTDFLTHILNRTLEVNFKGLPAQEKSWQRLCRKGEAYSDNRDHTHFILGAFPDIDTVAEGGTYTEMGAGKLDRVTSSSVKKGNYWAVTEESIQDDELDYIKMSVQQIARAANRTMERQALNSMFGYNTAWNNATMTDSIAGNLYSYANRKNYINGGADEYEKIKDLVNLMLTQQDLMDDDGTRAGMILYPKVVACNIMNKGKIRAMLKAEKELGRNDDMPNSLYFMQTIADEDIVGIHPAYMYDHPEALFMLPDPMSMTGIMLKYFRGMETPELIWEGNQQPAFGSMWSSDTLKLKVKFKYRLFVYNPAAFYGMFLDA